MITYDLKCENGHRFEGWFASREEFERQLERKLISCPVCESRSLEKQLSAVAVHVGGGEASQRRARERLERSGGAQPGSGQPGQAANQPNIVGSFMRELTEFVEKNFEDVGEEFASEARKIASGEKESRSIRGVTTKAEEEALSDEGIEFFKLSLPKYDA